MKPWTVRELMQQLRAEGHAIPPEEIWRDATRLESELPWFSRLMMGAGAWFGAILLTTGLVTLLGLEHQSGPGIVIGLMTCAGACLLRAFTQGTFYNQLMLAASLAGQCFFGLGLAGQSHFHRQTPLWTGMLILELVLLGTFRDALHRFISTVAATVFFALILREQGSGTLATPAAGLILALWWSLPPRIWTGGLGVFRRPVIQGLSVAFLGLMTWRLFFDLMANQRTLGLSLHDRTQLSLFSALVLGTLLAFGVFRVLSRLQLLTPSHLALAAPALVGLGIFSYWAQGLPAGLFVLLLATEEREPQLFAFAALAGIAFLGHFYYALQSSLIAKSGLLVLSGAMLLALRALIGRRAASC